MSIYVTNQFTKVTIIISNTKHSSSIYVYVHVHTLFLNDINGYVYEVLELKISLILGGYCSDVQREVLWRSKTIYCSVHMYMKNYSKSIFLACPRGVNPDTPMVQSRKGRATKVPSLEASVHLGCVVSNM